MQKRTRKEQGCGPKEKGNVRQGSNKKGHVVPTPSGTMMRQIEAATAPIRDWAVSIYGEHHSPLSSRLSMTFAKCQRCFIELQKDCDTPSDLIALHDLLKHTTIDKKATKEKIKPPVLHKLCKTY
jgi:hypothetical protein